MSTDSPSQHYLYVCCVALAVMPEGVEHTISHSNMKRINVALAVMPEGVEHFRCELPLDKVPPQVALAVMPEGVEHLVSVWPLQ